MHTVVCMLFILIVDQNKSSELASEQAQVVR